MKYNICINQKALSAFKGLDLKDGAILDYLYIICNSRNKKILRNRDQQGFNWVNYKRLIQDNPLLGIQSRNAITPRIHKLENAGFIKTKLSQKNGVKRLCIKLTAEIDRLYLQVPEDRVRETDRRVRETDSGVLEQDIFAFERDIYYAENEDCSFENKKRVRETDKRVRETDSEDLQKGHDFSEKDAYNTEKQEDSKRVRETDRRVREKDRRVRETEKRVRETVHNNTTTDNNIKVKEKYKKEKNAKSVARFTAPIDIDVSDYFLKKIKNKKKAENQAALFYAFYASKNWMVGKNKMKNWKAAASGWITRQKIKDDERTSQNHRDDDLQNFAKREFGIIL